MTSKIEALRDKVLRDGWDGTMCCCGGEECCCGPGAYRNGVYELWKKFFDDTPGGCWELLEMAFKLGRESDIEWENAVDKLIEEGGVP